MRAMCLAAGLAAMLLTNLPAETIPNYPFTRNLVNGHNVQIRAKVLGRTASEICLYLLNDPTKQKVLYPILQLSLEDQAFFAKTKIGGDVHIESAQEATYRTSAEQEIAGVEEKIAAARKRLKGATATGQRQAIGHDIELLETRLKDLKKRLKEHQARFKEE